MGSFYWLSLKQIINILEEENLINDDGAPKEAFDMDTYRELEFPDSDSYSDSNTCSSNSDFACVGICVHFIRYIHQNFVTNLNKLSILRIWFENHIGMLLI